MLTPRFLSSPQSNRGAFAFASTTDALEDHFHYYYKEKFTGQLTLEIQTTQARPWSLYFEEGNLIWGDGGVHPVRRLYRQLLRQCSAEVAVVVLETANQFRNGNYEFLTTLLLQKKIQQQDVEGIATGLLTEILFDLHQQWARHLYSSTLQLNFNYNKLIKHEFPVAIAFNYVWLQATQAWQEWQDAGLGNYIPNQAPLIGDAELLQQRVLPSTYENLATAMDGNQSLRDLAAKSNRNLVTVTKSLLPYIQQGLVKLCEIEDLSPSIHSAVPQTSKLRPHSKTAVATESEAPLIAYIDDHKMDGQIMNRILTQRGYRFIHIQDPIQALPLLLEHKPELIFLDLVMPIINGYEACAQIRRISRFKETPIIILTSNDGIVDRVRAKIVGSTGFLAKPIEATKVQAVLQKYLQGALPE